MIRGIPALLSVLVPLLASCTLMSACACQRGPQSDSKSSAKKTWSHEAHDSLDEPSAAPAAMPNDDVHAGLTARESFRDTGEGDHEDKKEHNTAGGITWKAPASFQSRHPNSSMRSAEYVLGDINDEQANAELVVYYFGASQGGSVRENLDRWRNQFSPDKRAAKETSAQVDKLEVTILDVRGVYLGMAMPGQTPSEPKAQQRMLAAVVEGLEGPVFFKVVGPEKLITANEKAFQAMIHSIKRL